MFLTLITFLPLVGALIITFLPKEKILLIKQVALFTALIVFGLSVMMLFQFDTSQIGINNESTFQFVEHHSWIPTFNIEYFMGVDGLSFPMILLTTLISVIALIASWNIPKAHKGYFGLFLLLETGMIGSFCALDFFLFYVFWEVMLLPMYFLIGIWGGPRREYAAIKFFLYTLFGSVLMLLAMLALYFVNDPHTFNMLELMANGGTYGRSFQLIVFVALFIGFAIKVPVFPFHTWLPDAHVEAPTAISVILAAVLLKFGTYGMLRINFPMLPYAANYFAYGIAILGLINIIYGAFTAMAQTDMKKLIAYSSISHMGYVLLGMAVFTEAGINGAVLQMFNHGTISALLFIIAGIIYDRAHHREIAGFGGLAVQMPIYAGITSFAFFASLGLPGLAGFISEAMVFIGAFPVYKYITAFAVGGVIITAAYYLWTFQRMFLGKLNEKYTELKDINLREVITVVPLMILILFVGIYPMPIINLMKNSLNYLITVVHP
ncbi:MAG: NADH-quinone oxidoreductase subunit M [bacterium]|nr:NADH-quinone oxidoreductase subunit M [bacterium]